jgi:hypothetical protein
VVRANDQADLAHESADAIEHLLALERVSLDDRPLVRVELARLVDDLFRDRDLADVVQKRGELQVALPLGAEAPRARSRRAALEPGKVAATRASAVRAGKTPQVALRFTALTGLSEIDDVFVDPHMIR